MFAVLIAVVYFHFCGGVINKWLPIGNQSFTRCISFRVKADFPEDAHLREDTRLCVQAGRLWSCSAARCTLFVLWELLTELYEVMACAVSTPWTLGLQLVPGLRMVGNGLLVPWSVLLPTRCPSAWRRLYFATCSPRTAWSSRPDSSEGSFAGIFT